MSLGLFPLFARAGKPPCTTGVIPWVSSPREAIRRASQPDLSSGGSRRRHTLGQRSSVHRQVDAGLDHGCRREDRRHRELATTRPYDPTAGPGGVRVSLIRLTGCARPACCNGQAARGAEINPAPTVTLDYCGGPKSRARPLSIEKFESNAVNMSAKPEHIYSGRQRECCPSSANSLSRWAAVALIALGVPNRACHVLSGISPWSLDDDVTIAVRSARPEQVMMRVGPSNFIQPSHSHMIRLCRVRNCHDECGDERLMPWHDITPYSCFLFVRSFLRVGVPSCRCNQGNHQKVRYFIAKLQIFFG